MAAHPSSLEIDRHVLGVARDAATAQHLAGCARCQAHAARVAPAESVPAWVYELEARTSGPRLRAPLWAALTAFVAVAAALLLWAAPRELAPSFDGVKGSPSVAIYVKRADAVKLWNGAPLATGDSLRLEVRPEEFTHVAVVLESAAGPELLYLGAVAPHARSMLPKAWQLEATPRREQLSVLFSTQPLGAARASALLAAATLPAGVYIVRLPLPVQLE